jgi:hypothetical protein
MKPTTKLLLFTPLLLMLTGCAYFVQKKTEREMEMVARRWCMTIRASQIIPTYPLNEDIQPGDIFVVETPAQRQAKDYNQRGYLDLEHLLVRLNSTAYPTFYSKGYQIGEAKDTPRHWQFPKNTWSNAPMAGFPSYNIEVKKSGGFNAAFPISGIPVGLSFVDGAQASVNVQLTKAHTFGLDQASLEGPFREWLKNNTQLTHQYARPEPHTAYLRLVTRVFLVEAVNVTVTGDQASSFSGSGGVPKDVPLLHLQKTNAVANYTNAISKLAQMIEGLSESAPGGTLKLASASSHSISMTEEFDRPLVIGYIAQDYPISPEGKIGNPISTKEIIEGKVRDPLALSMASLQAEQRAAAVVATECVASLEKLPSDKIAQAVDLGVSSGVLSDIEKGKILAKVPADSRAALAIYANALDRKARGAAPENRCQLISLSKELKKLAPSN